MSADLVYDVGMNNGDDTAYYLKSGFRVVGIEANPVMIAACRERFHEEVRTGQLTLVNAAIAEQDGVANFYIAEADGRGALSSLNPALAGRWGPVRRIQVSARRFRGLLDEFGVPYYLKVYRGRRPPLPPRPRRRARPHVRIVRGIGERF